MDNYTVYMHKNKTNGKVYIGITRLKPERRWRKGTRYNENKYFTSAIQKYGWDGFEHVILYSGLSKEQAEEIEIKLITEYKATNREYGYNIENGGNATGKISEETRKKISLAHKGKKLTPEQKEKRKGCQAGEKHPLYGKHHKESTKQLLREKFSKKVICLPSGEIFNSIKEAGKCKNLPATHISKCCRRKVTSAGKQENGEKLYWEFYKDNGWSTEEWIDFNNKNRKKEKPAIITTRYRRVLCVTTNKQFDSVKEAAEYYGCNRSCISDVCRNTKRKTAGKLPDGKPLKWKYIDEDMVYIHRIKTSQ